MEQVPVAGANALEFCMLEELAVVSLAYHGIDYESYMEETSKKKLIN